MNSPLCNENNFKHRPSRRWLGAIVIACCTSSTASLTATAQTAPIKSAQLLKSASSGEQVHSGPSDDVQPESAEQQPARSPLQSLNAPEFGPRGPSPKSARLLGAPGQSLSSGQPADAALHPMTLAAAAPADSAQFAPPPALAHNPVQTRSAGPALHLATMQVAAPLPSSIPTQGSIPTQSSVPTQAPSPVAADNLVPTPGMIEPPSDALAGQSEISSEAAGGLSLAALESMALAANPSLERASAAVAAARGAAVQAGLPFNPTVGYEGQQIGSSGLAEQHGVLVSQEFLRHEKRNLSREVACREVQMAEYRYVAQRSRVLTDVRTAYYRALRAQRQIDMSADLHRISQQALRAARALAEAKEIARTDVLQAQIEVDAAQASLDNAHNQHQSAWNQLAAVTGQSQLQVVPLDGDLFAVTQDLQFDEVLAWLRGQSPEIAVAVTNVQRARLVWQRQRVEPRPNLSVQGLYNFVDNGIGGDPDAAVAVSVPVPLFNRNQGAIQQARYEVVVAERSLSQLELALQQRLAPVYERYRNSRNLVQQYGERILPAAAEVMELMQKAFEVGEIGFTNLLIAQRSYRQQQLAYLEAAEALRVSEAEIDGLLLWGSLTEPPL